MGALFLKAFEVGSRVNNRQLISGLLLALIGYLVYAHNVTLAKFDSLRDAVDRNQQSNVNMTDRLDKVIERHNSMQWLFMQHTLHQQNQINTLEQDAKRLKEKTGLEEEAPSPRKMN